jgi:hypothetical protein
MDKLSVHQKMNKENVVYIHNGIIFHHKKEGNPVISDSMMELGKLTLSEIKQEQKKPKNCIPPMYVEFKTFELIDV